MRMVEQYDDVTVTAAGQWHGMPPQLLLQS
jgi:hypothetical protein